MENMSATVERYPFIAMDTEFPGVVAKPIGHFRNLTDRIYQTLRCNVNLLRLIQVGLTFCDKDGVLAEPVCTWQLNFKFSLEDDLYAPDSIELLQNSGFDFERHSKDGIEVEAFGELLMMSGMVLTPDVRWLTFHAGYDFAYLVRILTGRPLPTTEQTFFIDLHTFFPHVFDIKYLMKSSRDFKGGLDQLAEELEVDRIGTAHQAGSDSLLTQATFFKLMRNSFRDDMEKGTFDEKYSGMIHSLGQYTRPTDVVLS